MSKRSLAFATLLFSTVFGGGNVVFIKVSLLEIPNFSFLFLRCLLSLVMLLPFCYREVDLLDLMEKIC